MNITINPEVLKEEGLTLGEFLILLMGFYHIDYEGSFISLEEKQLIGKDIYNHNNIDKPVLSGNTKELITRILAKSDPKLSKCGIDNFEALADKLRALYPSGKKSGTTYLWGGTTEEIAQKLRTLVVLHDFTFTEEEAIHAVTEYLSWYKENTKYMRLLKYFILKTNNKANNAETNSPFMSIIEHFRNK